MFGTQIIRIERVSTRSGICGCQVIGLVTLVAGGVVFPAIRTHLGNAPARFHWRRGALSVAATFPPTIIMQFLARLSNGAPFLATQCATGLRLFRIWYPDPFRLLVVQVPCSGNTLNATLTYVMHSDWLALGPRAPVLNLGSYLF